MQKNLSKSKKALSSLSLIILLLIAAIIGGIISYLWVTGYYVSLKEKIPSEDIAVITKLSFNPQDATAFNATVLNPSYSPDPIVNVTRITITGGSGDTVHDIVSSVPSLPFSLSRGTNQTFTCKSSWAQYVNQTVTVSASVQNGTGSISVIKLPYAALKIDKVDFNSTLGVNNFTITLRNDPLSATYLNITTISLPGMTPPINFTTLLQPSLPFTLFPNKSETFLCNYNWLNEARIGGFYGSLNVTTLQGYAATSPLVQIPKLAFAVQAISFNPADTMHFNVTVKNQVSTNTYLNVTSIQVLVNGTAMNVTTPLSPSTNGVLGNQTATFKCAWNWTNYRRQQVITTVYMLQGINATYPQLTYTPPAGLLKITGLQVFPNTQHVLVTVQNSQYSTQPASVTTIQAQLKNATPITISGVYPSLPQLVGIGNTTMFSLTWNWTNYLNKATNITVYTSEGYSASYALTTPSNVSNYQVYLTIPSAIFNKTDTAHLFVNVTNGASSIGSANVTRITILLENGTEINATITSQMVPINSTTTFTCVWDWSTYRNKSIVIRVYTSEGLRAIYVTKTS